MVPPGGEGGGGGESCENEWAETRAPELVSCDGQVLRLTPVHRTGGPHSVALTPEKLHHD